MIGSPNFISYIALFLWIPATMIAFARLRPAMATMVSVLGGVMFLPEQLAIDPPLLPPIDKLSITSFWTLIGCLWKARDRIIEARPFRGLDALFLLVLIGNVGTAITNADPLVTGPVVRQGLTLYDSFAGSVKDILSLYLPFFLARAMLRTSRDLNDLMRILVTCGVIYACLALIEVRMSPQLHRWIYGFHQMDFSMTMRFGGYRPMVFMLHGLATALFILCTAVAAWARYRAGQMKPWVPIFLTVVLVLCKSTGAVVYAVVVIPLAAWLRKPKMWLPSGLAFMVLLFPALRGTDIFPTDTLVEQAEKISEERALSLWFRFDQEDQLLERARERFVFGWGTYNRNRIYDPETGEDLSITDGDWMIQVGSRGLIGFFGLYGILGLSIVIAQRRLKRIASSRDRILLSALALISALETVDLLPNGLFHYLPFFFAGAVAGLSDGMAKAADVARRRAREAKAQSGRKAREERVSLPAPAPRSA
jgi:hypothetical protein